MGQTLTHGIYLPDEGERNCYNGLAANWQLLDGAVGTVAEHSTQISGKAPLVHTHTKSDITDFPAYGTTAGTICEGNDARLSDARTPVAHTHTKSDVTDLFNSANTWTGDNTFSNTLNVQTGYTLGTLPQAESAVTLFTGRTADNNFVTSINFYQNPTKGTGLRFTIRNKWDNNGYSTTGTTRNAHFELLQSINKTAYMQWEGYVNNGLYPLADNTYDLGSSSYRWKTLNGINPGALSLPSGGTTENTDWYNVAGDILPTGGNATSFNRDTANYFTPAKDGWLSLAVKNCSEISVWSETLKYGVSFVAPDTSSNRQVVVPVVAGISYQVRITGNSWVYARLIMPKGNV